MSEAPLHSYRRWWTPQGETSASQPRMAVTRWSKISHEEVVHWSRGGHEVVTRCLHPRLWRTRTESWRWRRSSSGAGGAPPAPTGYEPSERQQVTIPSKGNRLRVPRETTGYEPSDHQQVASPRPTTVLPPTWLYYGATPHRSADTPPSVRLHAAPRCSLSLSQCTPERVVHHAAGDISATEIGSLDLNSTE
jgi:hypothetical protein